MKKQVKKTATKKEFFGWGEKKYTEKQMQSLLEKIKSFNCGAIDGYLTKHVDCVFKEWIKENK
jgi:hypothetical protein